MKKTIKKRLHEFLAKHKAQKFTWFMILLTWGLFFVHAYTHLIIPLNELMYALMFVVGSYTGVDQFAAVMATRKLPSGQKYTENSDKLYTICFAMIIILFTTLILAYLHPEIAYPMDLVFLSVGVILGSFVAGEKGKNAFEKDGAVVTNKIEESNNDEDIEDYR